MAPSDDEALLARLNALRTSSISLSPSSTSTSRPLSIPKPIQTPESTLSSRLKALRTASESSTVSLPRPSSPPPTPAPISPRGKEGSRLSLSSPHHDHTPSSAPRTEEVKAVFDDASRQADWLRSDLAKTRLFDRNADEDLRLAREATAAADEVGKEIKTKRGDEENVRGRDDKVERLRGDAAKALERARKTLAGRDGGVPQDSDDEDKEKGDDSDEDKKQKDTPPEDSDDDSDDDNGSKRDEDEEADALIAELMDDVGLDFEEDSRRGLHQHLEGPGSPPQLPPPPSLITPVQPTSPQSKDPGAADEEAEDQDNEEEDDFHRLMASRMSALRTPSPGLNLPSAPSSAPVNNLGLPSTPKDKISSLSVSQQPKEDYICKICYDKATIFCEGCEEEFEEYDTKDDAMYCARCWKEAHLGETADEEERQHQWVTVRRGK